MSSPWSRRVVFVRAASDRLLVHAFVAQLRHRGMAALAIEPAADWHPSGDDLPVFVVPDRSQSRERRQLVWSHARAAHAAGRSGVLVLRGGATVDRQVEGAVRAVIRVARADTSADQAFSELLEAMLDPMPPWLRFRAIPTLVSAPTGVTWWNDELLIADERFGHVVASSVSAARPILPGLDDPHHIHLDRNKLLIANRSADEVLLATLRGGAAADIASVRHAAKEPLLHPNGVHQSHGRTLIADTDRHRVLMSEHDPFDAKRPRWQPLRGAGRLGYPCGVCGDGRYVWVADTFNHRVLAFDRAGDLVAAHGRYGWESGRFAYPVGLVRWRDLLIVADEEPQRLQVFRVRDGEDGPALIRVPEADALGAPWVTRPFGLSVNLHGELAVSDRTRRCVWTLDLRAALQSVNPQLVLSG